jgi:hypothetical protein
MFDIKCKAEATLRLTQLHQFQGALKKRSTADIDALIASIKEEGLLMPLAIWFHDDTYYILDGHARYEAFIKMALDDPDVLTAPLPIIIIEAETEEDAKKALLQITSAYGKVTKKGLAAFTASIPNYVPVAPIAVKVLSTAAKAAPKVESDTVILHLSVKKDVVVKFTALLAGVEGVAIL